MSQPPTDDAEYSPQERQILIRLAHESITARLQRRTLEMKPDSAHLAERRGAFTTIHVDGALHGCIGYVVPVASLYQTIAETAAAAAFEDPRFNPITSGELPHLKVEISVLSLPKPVSAMEVQVGRHGLIVSLGPRRGLLLPQVPGEYGWDRETFLCQTCIKAGLPPDSWQHGALLEAFTAEVFGEL